MPAVEESRKAETPHFETSTLHGKAKHCNTIVPAPLGIEPNTNHIPDRTTCALSFLDDVDRTKLRLVILKLVGEKRKKMIDPLTALSIASSVIQIVEFGCHLVSQTQEIYHSASGSTKDNVTSGEIASDMDVLYTNLTRKDQVFHRLNPDDIALGKLVDSCRREAVTLKDLIAELVVRTNKSPWESFRIAMKSARKKGKVKDIETRVLKIQRQIHSRLQVMMTYVFIGRYVSLD